MRIRSVNAVLLLTLNLRFSKIAVGYDHTCALAMQPMGKLYCWGDNNSGKLGIGAAWNFYSTPTAVNSSAAFVELSVGWQTTCGKPVTGGWLCWGTNWRPRVTSLYTPNQPVSTPTAVVGDPGFISMSVGQEHMCGITVARDTYCWGLEHNGAITVPLSLPRLVIGSRLFRTSP